MRPAGNRIIEELRPFEGDARRHLPYAWIAQAAYEKTPAANTEASSCQDADEALKADWTMWTGFPKDEKLLAKIEEYHLRVEVWSRRSAPEVVVAFGGTLFDNRNDWRANLRWFVLNKDDQYTLVVKEFAGEFKDELSRRMARGEWQGKAPVVIATGHSLGGGLAQQLAYALPRPEEEPRVSQVFAFHPSPVTGYFALNEDLRQKNSMGLKIERIYERGEILAVLRSAQNLVFKPSEVNPAVTGYRYSVISQLNPIGNHSIGKFACALANKLHQTENGK